MEKSHFFLNSDFDSTRLNYDRGVLVVHLWYSPGLCPLCSTYALAHYVACKFGNG